MNNKRKDYNIELLRSIAILLVIFIHVCNHYLREMEPTVSLDYLIAMIYNVFSRISVPLFFMISGAFAFDREFDFHRNNKRILHMLIVLCSWTVIYWFWNLLYLKRDMLSGNVLAFLFEPVKNHLWYMYVFIAILIAQPIIGLMVKNMNTIYENYFLATWLLLCGGMRLADSLLDYVGVQEGLEFTVPIIQSTYYLGYYICGYIIYKRLKAREYSANEESHEVCKGRLACHRPVLGMLSFGRPVYLIVCVLSLVCCFAVTVTFSICFSHSTDKGLFGYSNILIMIGTLCFFILIMKTGFREHKAVYITGSDAFGIYLSHIVFFSIIYRSIDLRSLNAVWSIPLTTIAVLLITMVFVEITKRIPGLSRMLY